MNLEHFENLVDEAIESIPESLFRYMENVEILVEEWPTQAQRHSVDIGPGNLLLGLYEGIPLTERTAWRAREMNTSRSSRGCLRVSRGGPRRASRVTCSRTS